MKLRPYQEDVINRSRQKLRELNQTIKHRKPRLVVQVPPGGGKTILAAAMSKSAVERGGSVGFLCHRDFLLEQTSQTYKRLDIDHSFLAAGKWLNPWSKCHIGMIGSMKSRQGKIKPPSLCFIDECFPAGTLVDGTRIEDIKLGDHVASVNHTTGVIERKKVTRLYRSSSSELVSVRIGDVKIVCTRNHPFFCLGKGYVNAESIEGETVAIMRGVLDGIRTIESAEGPDEKSRAMLLLESMLDKVSVEALICDNGANEQGLRLKKNERKKPYEQSCVKGEDEGKTTGNRAQAKGPRREWTRRDCASAGTIRHAVNPRSRNGIHLHDEGRLAIPEPLQNRYCNTKKEDCDRGGWSISQLNREEGPGQEEGGPIAFKRVDSVQVLEQGDSGGTPVFNIEVEGNNNYFANGVLVHNCHHAPAKSWNAVLDAWPETTFILLSGTPGARTDGIGLGVLADDIVLGPSVSELIAAGALSDYEYYAPSTPDLRSAKVKMGEYVTHDVDAEMSKSVIIGNIVDSYRKHADGTIAVYFAPSIETSRKYAQAFNDAGIPAAHVDADTPSHERTVVAKKLATRELLVMCNVGIACEGYDLSAQAGVDVTIETVGLCRPTKSFPLLVQMAMRSMRAKPYSGIILDHAGSYKEHNWLPDDHVEWSLESGAKRVEPTKIMQCDGCGAALKRSSVVCHACGLSNATLNEIGERDRAGPEHIEGELERLNREEERRRREVEVAQMRKDRATAKTFEELIEIEKRMGYKPGWARHVWKSKQSRGR